MKQIINRISRATWVLGLLLPLIMILTPSPLQANGFGEQEVRAAVETWVRYVTADARPDAVVERMEPYKVNGETVAYIAHLEDGGFCITGADALLLPVYFYSPQGTYDAENPGLQYILWEIGARLEYIRQDLAAEGLSVQQYQDELSERAAYWQDLIAGRVPVRMESQAASAEPVMVQLDLTSQWHQRSPYNDQTPTLPGGSGNHTRVGCVATAMAQIMYYWKWPQTGVGNVSVTYSWRSTSNWITKTLAISPNIGSEFAGRLQWTPAGGGELQMNGDWDDSVFAKAQDISNDPKYREALQALWDGDGLTQSSTNHSANLGLATYNWGILQDTHGPPPDPGDVEAAKLSYHAGLAAKMNYGIWASGANRQDMVEALENNFRFDQDATLVTRDINIMTEEIQWFRPIAFAGRDNKGAGHVWVIYGYNKGTDPQREFLMNLGWTNPTVIGWFSYDNVPQNFNNNQEHITRIAPLNVVRFVGASDSGDGTPDSPYQHIEEAITAAPSGATLIFKAGSDNTFSASTLTINRPLTLKGIDITIRKE